MRLCTPTYGAMAISPVMLDKLMSSLTERGLDQDELEVLAGLAKGRITKWKDGQGEPSARQAVRIAKALNVDVVWLIDDEKTEPTARLTRDEEMILGAVSEAGLEPRELSGLLVRAAVAKRSPLPDQSKPPRHRQG